MTLTPQNRQKFLMIAAGAGLLLLVADSAILGPLTASWTSRSAEIARLQKNVTEGRGIVERADRTRRLWTEMQAQALPKDAAKAEQDLVSAFDRWGRSANVELAAIKPQWKRGSNPRYSLLECRVDASGSLATLARFLHEVERSPLALRVEAVELTARDDSGARLSLGLLVSGLRLSPLEGRP